jgi:predicted CXXCH cytochrome family protein
MLNFGFTLRSLGMACLIGALPLTGAAAADEVASSFGKVAIPAPIKPAGASECVEPIEVMRRDHMKFLMHQRDATVIEGERKSKYSLVGCMDCHNPASASDAVVRYENPRHFCAGCHAYASVKIDCFECHADRGLARSEQSRLTLNPGSRRLSAQTFSQKLVPSRVD